MYDPTPGGGEDRPGTEGYLKMAVVYEGGLKVFFEGVPVQLVPFEGIVCEVWWGFCGRNDRGGLIGGE